MKGNTAASFGRSVLALLLTSTQCAATSTPIRIGVILGRNNHTTDGRRPRTSDQEQWAVTQAANAVSTAFTASGGLYTLDLSVVFTGEDSGSVIAFKAVEAFLQASAARGAGIVVGAYLSESHLLAVRTSLPALGLTLLAPASGLPSLPAPRERILRLWPNDKWQVSVLARHLLKGARVAVLSRADLTGKALTSLLATALGPALLPAGGPFYYNHTEGASSYGPPLAAIRTAIAAASGATHLVCNCGSDEIGDILDTMRAGGWPADKTRLVLTDRATPTRAVVASPRKAFAAAMHTRGVLSHLPTTGSPSYAALNERWRADGHATSLFASALSAYDAVRIAALASVLAGGGNTTGTQGLTPATVGVAGESWGASGMMSLDGEGDLYRAVYDVYAVSAEAGWAVVGDPIDARTIG